MFKDFSKWNIEYAVLAVYTLINAKFLYFIVNSMGEDSIWFVSTEIAGNSNLLALFLSLFLNTLLLTYVIKNKVWQIVFLSVYTILTLMIILPFMFNDALYDIVFKLNQNVAGGGHNLLVCF